MGLELWAIDLGKRSFHIHGIDAGGVILSRKISRAKLAEGVEKLAPTIIAMKACANAHYWAWRWLAAVRRNRLPSGAIATGTIAPLSTTAFGNSCRCHVNSRLLFTL